MALTSNTTARNRSVTFCRLLGRFNETPLDIELDAVGGRFCGGGLKPTSLTLTGIRVSRAGPNT